MELRNDPAFLKRCIDQMIGIDADIQKRYRVYCLTTNPHNTLMWSHYADNHAGIYIVRSIRQLIWLMTILRQCCYLSSPKLGIGLMKTNTG